MLKSTEGTYLAFRLYPHQDLKKSLLNICLENKIKAACLVSAIGSLEKINLRLANSNEYLTKDEKFEVLALNGLISIEGAHLHMSVANALGQVFGGHVMDENLIYTTCEVVLLVMNDLHFLRVHDPETGFKELKIDKL